MIYINNKEIGKKGEEISCQYLQQNGYKILDRNFFCNQGEIDIIAKDKNEYVFIEVKTRTSLEYGRPIESINKYKQIHLYKSAKYYLHIHYKKSVYVRFDVIEVYLIKNKYKLIHVKDVQI